MKRYEKINLEAEKGITFEVSKTSSGVITIKATKEKEDYNTEGYKNPPIPEGYKHILGNWNKGFVIERESDGSQFVWIPVGILEADGTLDGSSFTEKFGRRNFVHQKFSNEEFHESSSELEQQIESVKKYGGFYISRYNISRSSNGMPQSVKGELPWTKLNYYDSKEVSQMFESTDKLTSHLVFGSEYDTMLEWLIQTGARTISEVAADSSKWGNHWNTYGSPHDVIETGSKEEWATNNIYDIAGNVDEWTQEENGDNANVLRGGYTYRNGNVYPAAIRRASNPECKYHCTGFRIALCIA